MAPLVRVIIAFVLAFASFSSVCAQDVPIPLVCQTGVQVIALVGTNVTNGTYGLSVTFVEHVMDAIPGSGNFSVNYNRFPPGKETGGSIVTEVTEGVGAFTTDLENYAAACPNTPIVLHGYSEGGMVVMNTLCGASSIYFSHTGPLNSSYASNIIAVILYGEETRVANQPYNLGGCNSSAPYFARSDPAACNAFAPAMQSYCFPNDVDCCATANASAPYPYGIKWHYLYPAGFDEQATDFVVERYNAYRNRTSTSSSASSTATTSRPASTSTSFPATTTTSKPISTPSSSASTSKPTSVSSSSSASKPASSSSRPTTSTSSRPTTSTSRPASSSKPTTSASSSKPATSASSSKPTTSIPATTVTTATTTHLTTTTTVAAIPATASASTAANNASPTPSATHPSHTPLSIAPSCSAPAGSAPDKCLDRFAAHPTIASRFCSRLAAGKASGSPFPRVCTGDYASRVQSVCGCLVMPTETAAA